MTEIRKLGANDLAEIIGTPATRFSPSTMEVIDNTSLTYQALTRDERDSILLHIIDHLNDGKLDRVGEHRQGIWEASWRSHKQEFIKNDFNMNKCIPSYMYDHKFFRFRQDYFKTVGTSFLVDFYSVLRNHIFDQYFKDIDTFYEFGCGSGHNLFAFAKLYPGKKCYGLDWSAEAVETVNLIGQNFGLNMEGYIFDFFEPNDDFDIGKNSGVFTNGALEQVGENHKPFLAYLLKNKPRICINIEPILEFYDPSNLADYLAIQYHTKRDYLKGYLTELRELEDQKKVRIIKAERSYVGIVYDEGYSYVIWEIIDNSD